MPHRLFHVTVSAVASIIIVEGGEHVLGIDLIHKPDLLV